MQSSIPYNNLFRYDTATQVAKQVIELIPTRSAIDLNASLIVGPKGDVYLLSNNAKWMILGPYYFDNCGFSWGVAKSVSQ